MAQIVINPCRTSCIGSLERIEHPENTKDWDSTTGYQGYQIWRCRRCHSIWGQRYQWDPGTGSDDRWHNFGQNPKEVKRHY